MQQQNIWTKLIGVDRRILYLILFLNIAVFLMFPFKMPATITSPARGLYDAVDSLQPNDLVMISSNWSASTMAENQPQLEAIIKHLIRKGARFTLVSNEAQSRDLSKRIAAGVTQSSDNAEYHTYGQKWAHLGFVTDLIAAIRGMGSNLSEAVKQDVEGTPIDQLPVLQGAKSLKDYKMVIDVTPSGTLPYWISYRPPNLIVGYAPTSVMAAEGFTYLDSKQLVGMITGLKGAHEYEQLMGETGLGHKFINAISFSHVLILLFIGLGNLAMIMARRAQGEA